MSPSRKYLHKVKEVVFQHLKNQSVRVYLFGSWAKGAPRNASDIDLAILPSGKLDPLMIARLREALEESDIPYPVEITDLSSSDPSFRDKVKTEGLLWKD